MSDKKHYLKIWQLKQQMEERFEYALLLEFYERLKNITIVSITENESYEYAKRYFDSFIKDQQDTYRVT